MEHTVDRRACAARWRAAAEFANFLDVQAAVLLREHAWTIVAERSVELP